MEQTSNTLTNVNETTALMKAKHGSTKSERKNYRMLLHNHDTINHVSTYNFLLYMDKSHSKKYLLYVSIYIKPKKR